MTFGPAQMKTRGRIWQELKTEALNLPYILKLHNWMNNNPSVQRSVSIEYQGKKIKFNRHHRSSVVLSCAKCFCFQLWNLKNSSNHLTTVYIVLDKPKLPLLLLSSWWMKFFLKLISNSPYLEGSNGVVRFEIGCVSPEESGSEN